MQEIQFRYGDFFKEAWEKMKPNYWRLLGIYIFVYLIALLSGRFMKLLAGSGVEPSPLYALIALILQNVIGVFLAIGILRCLFKAVDGKKIDFSELFSGGDVFPSYLLGVALYSLLVLGGAIFLIIPGTILGVKYSFVPYLIVDKGMGVKEAFKESGEMTTGYKWKLFCLNALVGLLVLAAMLFTLGLGLVVVIPLVSLIYPLVYRKLSGEVQTDESTETNIEDIQSFDNWQ